MSTVVAVLKEDQIGIGQDLLSIAWGYRKELPEDTVITDKILRAGSSYIGLNCDPSIAQAVAHYIASKRLKGPLDDPDSIFDELLKLHHAMKEEYFLTPHENGESAFEASGFEALIVNSSGLFKAYDRRSVNQFSRFAAIGTGAEYALGALEALYPEPLSAAALVERAIQAAAQFDNETGACGPIHVVDLR